MSEDSRGRGRRAVRGGRRRGQPRRRKGLRVAAWVAAGVVLLGGGSLGWFYFKLNGNLHTVDIDQALGKDRPPNVDNGSMDILVLGSDSRDGANSEYGADDGGSARSDTAMIVHLYEGHKQASVVSIPRDTMLPRPACPIGKGKNSAPRQRAQFNEAFTIGGAACAVKTVEAMSGIRMDHYIEVDFTGFKNIIDNLGGVELTTTKPIKDYGSHLDLAAGSHKLNGEQSLGLVRTRKTVGDGGDLGRIQLQQAFIKALIKQVKGIGVFDSPKKLYSLADSATKAITTDKALGDVKSLASFAQGLQGISAENMHMITLPVTQDPLDKDRVAVLAKDSKMVWDALLADQPIPAAATEHSNGDKSTAGSIVQ
ncbi:LCP family protein [Streptomyces sp. NPDC089915]|uniref:LCP family protein n=1 Tax=Streptomyces sp. NPDC089915 TaxID=3155186 RepID=UPI0034465514